ncbi:MAG: gamma-glutamyltransferase [Gemmataceae bacterium]
METRQTRRTFVGLAAATLLGAGGATPQLHPSRGRVIGQIEAAAAGEAVLAGGGNAVDAAVTAALVAGVVAVPGCGIGGYGGHLVIARPGRPVVAIDFNTAAPAAAKAGMFAADEKGRVKDEVDTYGWLACGVPGTIAGLALALEKHGTRRFDAVVGPAIHHAREGFVVSERFAELIRRAEKRLYSDPGSRALFFSKDRPLAAKVRFRNPDLAALLETLAKKGAREFYEGEVARQIAKAFAANGGLLTEKDLAAYQAREMNPHSFSFQGHTVHTAPLTAGGLTVLQALATLEALGWARWDRKAPERTQARVEALRIAWHDRLSLLGDPDQVKVPTNRLLSADYAGRSAERVRAALKAKRPVPGAGDGRAAGGTVHLTTVDANGTLVALTLTHGGYFGAQVTVPGLGLLLGHGMSRFDPRAGRANSPGPGKRPLHNMCPTVVTKDGEPVLALGASGGRRIPNAVFDVLLGRLAEGMPLAEAVKAPRLHTEGEAALAAEPGWPDSEAKRLREVGYSVTRGPGAVLNAIERDGRSGTVVVAAR